jgi:hypothetical protein
MDSTKDLKRSQSGNSEERTVAAGSVGIMQPRAAHFGWTQDETIVQVHGVGPWGITYVNPDDDPRKK